MTKSYWRLVATECFDAARYANDSATATEYAVDRCILRLTGMFSSNDWEIESLTITNITPSDTLSNNHVVVCVVGRRDVGEED